MESLKSPLEHKVERADQSHMRCLYCGKELALLKRWTSGGEFCSDAHRHSYQEEYNKLALNRLLQAKAAQSQAPASNAADAGDETDPSVEPAVPALAAAHSAHLDQNGPRLAEHAIPAPVATLPPEPGDAGGPADTAGFLMEMPVPVMAPVTLARTDLDLESSAPPSLPRGGFDGLETQLFTAGRVELWPFTRILDCAPHPHDRRLEVREFVRATPVIEVELDTGANQVPEIVEEPMEILIDPQPPQGSPPLCHELWREFEIRAESGALARVAFLTTGLEDNADGNSLQSLSDVAAEVASEVAPFSSDHPHDPPPAVPNPEIESAPGRLPPPLEPAVLTAKAGAEIAAKIEESRPDPKPAATQPSRLSFLRWTNSAKASVASSEKSAAAAEEKPAPAPAESTSTESRPAVITKPLPVTLHGLAAGRGKSIQVFASPVWAPADLQIPRSGGLPLRPVMTLGPGVAASATPADSKSRAENKAWDKKALEKKTEERRPERTVVVKVDPKKGQRPDPRLAHKVRKDAPLADSPESKSSADGDKAISGTAAAQEKASGTQEKASGNTGEKAVRSPSAAPYRPPDLGIPNLTIDTSGGFWRRLPLAGKAGLAVTLIGLIAGISFILKSSAATAPTGPTVVEMAPLTGGDASWITDWGAEPGVRKAHDISVLRPSLNLTDYRLEFEAQIESKALGWIYRAQDEKNYYVTKLEIVKPGLEPGVALVRYAVIKGEEGPRAQFPLSLPLRIDTMYKIRFDALGDHFTTWVQDQKVDEWTDGRLGKGGVGLYSERGERINLKGTLRVAPLVIKK
jgi:hypothetical protein